MKIPRLLAEQDINAIHYIFIELPTVVFEVLVTGLFYIGIPVIAIACVVKGWHVLRRKYDE
jgi:hypothetical protein